MDNTVYKDLMVLCEKNWQEAKPTAEDVKNITNCLKELERIFFVEGDLPKSENGDEIALSLLGFLLCDVWEVKAKALITIGRVGSEKLAEPIIDWLKTADEPWWQLQGLDAWWQLPVETVVREKTLADLIEWSYQPVTVRSMVWLLKELTTEKSAWLFAKLAVSKKSMVVKDEMLEDCWYSLEDSLIEQGKADIIKEIIENVKGFKVWLNFHYREEDKSNYSLYPSPDYLWQTAMEYGVDRRAFKNLYHKPRKKDSVKANVCEFGKNFATKTN